ncbi:MAG: acyl-CoA/acyl-ACP dehydrogenase [Hyphomonadaceae bacterium]|nr:acyl-CoA/acyl-ACP dehydrogenase [Hyphomonadaceae bacterium]
MNFDFSEDQALVREQVRRLLHSHACPEMVRALLEGDLQAGQPAWQDICEMGVPATALPEALGGNGLGYLDLCVIAEELGAALVPAPVALSRFVAMEVLLGFAEAEPGAAFLQKLAEGRSIAAFADCRRPLSANVQIEGHTASGWFSLPVDGMPADLVVMVGPGGALFLLELDAAGVAIESRPLRDPSWPEQAVILDSAALLPLAAGPEAGEKLDGLLARSAVLVAFQQLGGAQRCLDDAVAYAKERTAFGREIGSFQALKHMLADLYVSVELARSNCYHGAWALMSDAPDLELAGALAHVSAANAYLACAKGNLQVHGAMGFTWDVDCHLHYRRALWLSGLLGGRQAWKQLIARTLRDEAAGRIAEADIAGQELADGL